MIAGLLLLLPILIIIIMIVMPIMIFFVHYLFRSTTQTHPSFNKDVVLLPHPEWSEVCKHKTKRRLHESGYILSAFEMRKMWDCRTVMAEIREAFKDRITVDVG